MTELGIELWVQGPIRYPLSYHFRPAVSCKSTGQDCLYDYKFGMTRFILTVMVFFFFAGETHYF